MKKILLLFSLFVFLCFPVAVVFAAAQVNINTASLAQLDEITGVGPATAQKIIDARPFSSVDDLLRVKGIGPKTLQKIKDQGLACVNCAASAEATASQANLTVIQTQTPAPTPTPTPKPTPTPTPDLTQTQTPLLTPAPVIVYPSGVFINELLPSPKGADETDEWIELYNSNSFDVDLSGWKMQDTAGTVTTFTINPSTGSGQAKILANSFLIFKRPDTKIMLNNDEDGLNLLTPDSKIVDSVSFSKAPTGQSYNRNASGWHWSPTLTPGTVNIITAAQTATIAKALPKAKSSAKNSVATQGLADLSQMANPVRNEISNGASPWFMFFTVLAITIILAIIVLIIKIKFKNYERT
ncbi:MAG: helix-hairpin-helix domain-containing protein [Candidatus Staskawiczbacteria bacterium]|nr:helix-hairpin-helix domain-containing protein [Candidatus Staskawiczbacteria bacterium]